MYVSLSLNVGKNKTGYDGRIWGKKNFFFIVIFIFYYLFLFFYFYFFIFFNII